MRKFKKSRIQQPFRLHGEALEKRLLLAFDPSGMEQAYVESLNRMRMDPQGELDVLFSSLSPLRARDSRVQSAMDFFNVNSQRLLDQWSQLEPVGPLAWNEDLFDAAEKHNLAMQRTNMQEHQVPGEDDLGERVEDEGYNFRRLNENIFAYAEGHIHGHAGFVIDWGQGPGGIQDPPGHRDAIMDGRLTDVGVAVLEDRLTSNDVGPYLVTQDFGQPRTAGNPFILGVTWRDNNGNDIYDPGEGVGNVSITVSGPEGTFTTTSMTAGGYQLRVPNGTYQVTASSASLGTFTVPSVIVAGSHRKVDFQPGVTATPPIANADTLNATEDGNGLYNLLANDRYSDGSAVTGTVEIMSDPTNGEITNVAANGTVTYRPNANYSGNDSFQYRVVDSQGLPSNVTTVTVIVTATNDAPTAQSFSVPTDQNQAVSIPLASRVNDIDGAIDWSSLEVGTANIGTATATPQSMAVNYSPPSGFTGIAQFTYRVADADGVYSAWATVSVTVADINDVPQVNSDIFAVVEGQTRNLAVLTNDSDADGDIASAQIVIASPATFGDANANGNTVQYQAPAGYVGADSFTYYVVDPEGARSNTGVVTIYITRAEERWRNPVDSRDVNGDGVVAAQDVIQVINRVGTEVSLIAPPPFVDVDGSGVVAPTDAIAVVNRLIGDGQAAPLSAAATASVAISDSDTEESPEMDVSRNSVDVPIEDGNEPADDFVAWNSVPRLRSAFAASRIDSAFARSFRDLRSNWWDSLLDEDRFDW